MSPDDRGRELADEINARADEADPPVATVGVSTLRRWATTLRALAAPASAGDRESTTTCIDCGQLVATVVATHTSTKGPWHCGGSQTPAPPPPVELAASPPAPGEGQGATEGGYCRTSPVGGGTVVHELGCPRTTPAPAAPQTYTCPCGTVPEPCPGPEDRPLCMRGDQSTDPLTVANPCGTCGHARANHHKLRCEHPTCDYCNGWTPQAEGAGETSERCQAWAGSEHVYLSTGCLHGEHGYCQAMTGRQGEKRPGRCKFCDARCVCPCHGAAGEAAHGSPS